MKNLYPFISLLITAGLVTPGNSTAQSHVATKWNYTGSSTNTIAQTFNAASTSGNLIVVHLSWDNQSRKISTVTDNKGNTYNRINGPTNWHTNYRSELWYAYNITGGGAPIKITAKLNGASTGYFQIYMSEYSGISTIDPLDQHSAAAGHVAAANSGAKTTTVANELIYGVSIGASGSLSAGGSFSIRSTDNQNIVEDKIGASIGSYSTSFTSGGGNWVAEMATFKPLILLPLVSIDFSAIKKNDRTVQLSWTTEGAGDNSFFEVQRSHAGSGWESVKQIKKANDPDPTVHYSTTDSTPFSGRSYYRLILSDLYGHSKVSSVVPVDIDPTREKKLNLYPNPAREHMQIKVAYTTLENICIVNYMGQMMNKTIRLVKIDDTTIDADLSSLPGGLYYIKTKDCVSPFYKL